MKSREAKYVVFQGECGGWYWHLKGANGEVICSSEAYTRCWSATRACRRARQLSRFAWIYAEKDTDARRY